GAGNGRRWGREEIAASVSVQIESGRVRPIECRGKTSSQCVQPVQESGKRLVANLNQSGERAGIYRRSYVAALRNDVLHSSRVRLHFQRIASRVCDQGCPI